MDFTGERLVPGKVDLELEVEHMNRYIFASDLVKDSQNGKNIYNPSTNKEVGDCLKITVTIENYQYQYNVSDEECNG